MVCHKHHLRETASRPAWTPPRWPGSLNGAGSLSLPAAHPTLADMTTAKKIPVGVSPEAARLLERA